MNSLGRLADPGRVDKERTDTAVDAGTDCSLGG